MNIDLLDALCKYKVGDMVAVRAQVEFCTPESGLSPQRLQIVERTVQQCYGGVQVHYNCRITIIERFRTVATVDKPWSFSEPELVPYPADPLPS